MKVMKLRYCCNLTTTPAFSEITNLEELDLEGCVNMVTIHPSIGMLKSLVVLNLKDCTQVRSFPSKVEMDSLQVLNLSGCLKVDQLPEVLGQIKTLTELHIDRTAITELPSFVSFLVNLELLSFGRNGRIQPRWFPFGLLSKQPHPQRSVLSSVTGLHMLKYLNLSYCNLEQVPESIGGLSCLFELRLSGNNFTSLPGNLSQLSHLQQLYVSDCKKLEVLPELPPSVWLINAIYCTSLREVLESSKDPISDRHISFTNCPKLFKNNTIVKEGSITSQGSIRPFFWYLGVKTIRGEKVFGKLDIVYHGNSMSELFRNRSTENHVKVELPSDWHFKKLRGFGTCVVLKCKKPRKYIEYSVKNSDGASLTKERFSEIPIEDYLKDESYIIWLHYTRDTGAISAWKKVKNFVTFCFEEKNEDVEVKEFGAKLICEENFVTFWDLQQDITNLSMFQYLPTLSQRGGAMCLSGPSVFSTWS